MNRTALLNSAVLALLIGTGVIAHLTGQGFVVTLATKAAIFALAGVGLNLCLGYGGLVSFGHAAFFGIGGYICSILAFHAANGTPLPLTGLSGTKEMLLIWPLAMLAAGLIALPIGILSLRTSGVYFIMVTLAFAQMVYYFAVAWPQYGGDDGMSFYVRNTFPGLNTLQPVWFFALCAGLLLLALGLSQRLTASRFGLALQAVKQNPARAEASGIRPFPLRLTAFVLSAMITGLAGALYADLNRFVSPSMLSWHMSGEIMVFVILGGTGRLIGPVLGAMAYILLEHLLGGISEYWQALLGLLLLAIVLFAPGGLIGLAERRKAHA